MKWLWWLEDGNQVGLYCSDVSGAFDRVDKDLLCRKLAKCKIPKCLFSILSSWLDDRISHVIVDGSQSDASPLTDSVFQGTVLGPPLWNQFYADAN